MGEAAMAPLRKREQMRDPRVRARCLWKWVLDVELFKLAVQMASSDTRNWNSVEVVSAFEIAESRASRHPHVIYAFHRAHDTQNDLMNPGPDPDRPGADNS